MTTETTTLEQPRPRAKRKRPGLVLLQLAVIAAILTTVWVSFGQNVLKPAREGVPQELGTLKLDSKIDGDEALRQVSQLHGVNIELVSAFVATYSHSAQSVKVWSGRAADAASATELINRMVQGIQKGTSPFTNMQQITVQGSSVYQLEGMGKDHFFYVSPKAPERVIWLEVVSSSPLALVEHALHTF